MPAERRFWPASLAGRMLAWSLLVMAIGGPALWIATSGAIRALAEEAVDTQLRAFGLQVRAAAVSAGVTGTPQVGVGDLEWVWQVDIEDRTAFRSELLMLTDAALTPSLDRPTAQFVVGFSDSPLGPMRLAERLVREPLPDGGTVTVRYLAGVDGRRFDAMVQDQIASLEQLTLRITVPSLILLGIAILVMLVTLHRSLAAVGRSLGRFEAGESERIGGAFPRELQDLVDRVNDLLGRNARLLARTRKYVSKIAHDLNHPLAVLRNGLPGGEESGVLRRQVDRMAGLVDRYANLAQAIGTDAGAARAMPVAAALTDIREGYAILFRQPPVEITVDCPEGLEFQVPRHDFEAAVGNLTANAHRFAKSRIGLAARLDGGDLLVFVDDDGPGIPADRRQQALGWGERLDEAPPGSGIGLAIVSDLIDLHGGTLRLDDSPLGGLRAELRLPASGTARPGAD